MTNYWLGFALIPSIGPKRFHRLLNHFPDLKTAWQASVADLEQAGIEEHVILELAAKRAELDLDAELEKLNNAQVHLLTLEDEQYPPLLREIYAAPPVLFWRGTLPDWQRTFVAIVGTRTPTLYGTDMAITISRDLATSQVVVVSGLALGIDTASHKATLDNHGTTIAVLGCGIDQPSIYPASNKKLAERIALEGGCMISEHPLQTPPLKQHFPQRNRIIAGLSQATLVVEAPSESGALITAKFALEQNRDVFAVPGNATNQNAEGSNNLIKMGAHCTTTGLDVLDALNVRSATLGETIPIVADTADEALLLPHLGREPVHIDSLVRLTNTPIQIINTTLTLMEMNGKVRHLGSALYVLAR